MTQKELTPASRLFQNRGLFSDHFSQERLPEWKEWNVTEELEHLRNDLLVRYGAKKPILPGL